ncbi:MAG: MBL fold metallo-hydrolase [Candidatus Hodarchaeales archaeon]|jgi:7,8-dihydropterin-6-yl-methyl-4-(beta-D-ribofuranosyl)aminobenzene 5'-phosphate synthase
MKKLISLRIIKNSVKIHCFGILGLILLLIAINPAKNSEEILTPHNQPQSDCESSVDLVKITVIIDNNPNGSLSAPWGLGILVETPNLTILFDAGPDPDALRRNAEILDISLDQLDCVVISHGHRDHVEGISYIAEQNPNITVFVPKYMHSFPKEQIVSFNANMVEIDTSYLIRDDIAIIGGLYDPVNEQALAINVNGLGLIIFVGCSHPGADNIVQKAINDLGIQPYALIGGFHLFDQGEGDIKTLIDDLLAMNLSKILPAHDSGEIIRNYLQSDYPSYYEEVKVGYSTIYRGNNSSPAITEIPSSGRTSSTERAEYPNFGFLLVSGGLILLLAEKRKN